MARGRVTGISTSFALRMIRRNAQRNAIRRLLRLAVACLILVGLAPSLQAGAGGDPAATSGLLVLSSLKPNLEADHHHSAVGHGAAGHCLSGSGCTSVAVLPDAAVLLMGKASPTLIGSAPYAHGCDTLPPLHPPNSANLG